MKPRARRHSAGSDNNLPFDAVIDIIKRVRGRPIPGTNRYARVCRQWRDANSNLGALEFLRLQLDLDEATDAQIAGASSWMALYGQHVKDLVVTGSLHQAATLDWLLQPAPTLTRLQRLEVHQKHSLALLAPVLGQLPELQHLAAHVGFTWWLSGSKQLAGKVAFGAPFFANQHDLPWEDLPNLQQLCPRLVNLELTLYADQWDFEMVHEQLSCLLPAGLHQLAIKGWSSKTMLQASSLMHLSALRGLKLDRVDVAAEGAAALVQHLVAMPQLEVSLHPGNHGQANVTEWLASKVTSYTNHGLAWVHLLAFPHLTCLALEVMYNTLPPLFVETLADLPGIRSSAWRAVWIRICWQLCSRPETWPICGTCGLRGLCRALWT